MKYSYPALSIRQTDSEKRIVLFAAPAVEINQWAGVPQKKQFGADAETVGFQREENKKRLLDLGDFCSNPENIIQNPLLCATRTIESASANFVAETDGTEDMQVGTLEIELPDFSALDFSEILGCLRDYIEKRVPELIRQSPDNERIAKLKRQSVDDGHSIDIKEDELLADDFSDPLNLEPIGAECPDPTGVLFEESHILDFWQEIACRHEIAKSMDTPPSGDQFLGFSRNSLISYLCPIVLVDGQHRKPGQYARPREMP